MARIALRVYNNEINDLIDHGQIDEAIAHCRHILQTYSKHVETYRLLGKAYLEEQRYGDAADILQRVLSSIPEDFISQVGMSIIREDEGNMDAAIYHMERAFETQPSNHAIQDELRRLFGRRDGLEPNKIRLTRGALARMYAHGNLHDQAIAELLAALSEDPQRHDLLVLLANMYYHSMKKVEAAETCTKILEKLPYCLVATSLLVKILEESKREEEAKPFRERWEELDPYAAQIDANTHDTEFVPDQAVTLERLDWEPGAYGEEKGQPAWASSLGISIGGEDRIPEAVPDWLSDTGVDQPEPSESPFGGSEEGEAPDGMTTPSGSKEQPEDDLGLFPSEGEEEVKPDWMSFGEESSKPVIQPPDEGEPIPDFLKEVGLEQDSGKAEEPPSNFDDTPSGTGSEGEEITAGEIPGWMKDLEPPEEEFAAGTENGLAGGMFGTEVQAEADPEWLQSLDSQKETETPDWLSELGSENEGPPLKGEETDKAEESLTSVGQLEEEPSPEPQPEQPVQVPSVEDQPDSTQPDPQVEPEHTMNFIDDLSKEAAQEVAAGEEAKADEWLASIGQPEEGPVPEPPPEQPAEPTPAPSEEEGLAWLEGLAAKQGIAEEELVTSPEERSEKAPDWLQPVSEEPLAEPQPEQPVQAPYAEDQPDSTQPDPQVEPEHTMNFIDDLSKETAQEAAAGEVAETDEGLVSISQPEEGQVPEPPPEQPAEPTPAPSEEEGLAWLEGLAAKQGIAEEELVTSPEERSGEPPDWLQPVSEEPLTESQPLQPDQPAPEEELSMDWLDDLSKEAAQEAAAGEVAETDEGLVSISQTEEGLAPEPLPEQPAEPTPAASEEDGLAWLESLAAKQGIPEEELVTSPEERSGEPPDWVQPVSEEPLAEPQPLQPDQPGPAEELSMDWLEDLSKEAAQKVAAGEVAESDEWLASLGQPEEVSAPEPPPEQPAEPTPSEEEGLAWLEGLASKQGITEEELVTSPEERSEESPDWLQQTGEEPLAGIQPVQPEKPALDQESMDWLENLSIEAAQEAALGEVVDTTDEWLDALSDLEEEIKAEVEPVTEKETTEDFDDLLQSLTQPEQEEAETIPLDTELPVEETPAVSVAAEQPVFEPEAETETPMVPDWLQDSAEQKTEPDIIDVPPEWIPEVEEPIVEIEVSPTIAEEWQPEAEAEAPPPPPPKPDPSPIKLDDTDKLDAARQDISIGNLEEAVKTYAKLVKRGKMVEEIIMDIQEVLRKHPVDVGLWQTLGDAYMRADRLQDALDSYSKAEDLLR